MLRPDWNRACDQSSLGSIELPMWTGLGFWQFMPELQPFSQRLLNPIPVFLTLDQAQNLGTGAKARNGFSTLKIGQHHVDMVG